MQFVLRQHATLGVKLRMMPVVENKHSTGTDDADSLLFASKHRI